MIINNFNVYKPEHPKFGDNAIYLISEDGLDWYDAIERLNLNKNSVKVVFDGSGLIVSSSRDASLLFPVGASIAEFDKSPDDVTGYYVKDGELVEPPPSKYHGWDGKAWVISNEESAALLAEQQDKARAKINAKRDAVLDAGCYVSAIDKVVDTSSKGLSDLRAMATDFELNGGTGEQVLICKDYTVKLVNHETFKAVWSAVWAFKSAVEETAVMHVNCMMASDDPASYDYADYWDELGA